MLCRWSCISAHLQCTDNGCTAQVNGETSIRSRSLYLLVNSQHRKLLKRSKRQFRDTFLLSLRVDEWYAFACFRLIQICQRINQRCSFPWSTLQEWKSLRRHIAIFGTKIIFVAAGAEIRPVLMKIPQTSQIIKC